MINTLKAQLFFYLFAVIMSTHAQSTLRLASIDYAPYYGPKLKNNGPLAEIIERAYQAEGYQIEISFLKWDKAYRASKEGLFDGIFTIWKTAEREAYFLFSDSLPANELVFFARKESTYQFTSYDQLAHDALVVGVVKSYANPQALYDNQVKTTLATTDIANFKNLARNRIHLLISDKALGYYNIKQNPRLQGKFKHLPTILKKWDQHIAFPITSDTAIRNKEAFNSGLKKIKRSGEFESILEAHNWQ